MNQGSGTKVNPQSPYFHGYSTEKRSNSHLRRFTLRAVKINCIKFQLLFTCWMGLLHKVYLVHAEGWLSPGKTLVSSFHLQNELLPFFTYIILLERLTNYNYSDMSVWQIFCQKMMKVSLLHTGKQLTAFVANDKIQAFMSNSKFWKNYIHHFWAQQLLNIQRPFWWVCWWY